MALLAKFEFESEAYTTVWLTQSRLKHGLQRFCVPLHTENILQNPRVFVLRHRRHDVDLSAIQSSLVNSDFKGKIVETKVRDVFKDSDGLIVVVVLLKLSGQYATCLSNDAIRLLEYLKKLSFPLGDAVYILQPTDKCVKNDTCDLDAISRHIQMIVHGNINPNKIFGQLFLLGDKQVPVRIGQCLLNNISVNLQTIIIKIKKDKDYLAKQLFQLNKTRGPIVQHFQRELPNTIYARPPRKSYTQIKFKSCHLVNTLKKVLPKKIVSDLDSFEVLNNIFEKELRAFFKQRNKISREISGKRRNGFKGRVLRSRIEKGELEHQSINIESSNVALKYETFAEKLGEITIDYFADVLHRRYEDHDEFDKLMQKEIFKANEGMALNMWKTVSNRHTAVSGFGFMNENVCIYVKEDCEDDKQDVNEFLQKYLDTSKFKFKIEYRSRKITLFSHLEQGSRINKTKSARTGPKHYGTLGMFLHDNNGTYFFTTCAHVIDENEFAYSPVDSSRLGVNALILNKNEQESKPIDFSLVRVCPESKLTCKFGLKTTAGNFIDGTIFKGDVSEVLQRNLYKWGATKPYISTGKCIGFSQEDCYTLLDIDNKEFAKPGDSGSLICLGEDTQKGIAAFVFVGVCDHEDIPNKVLYVVYKISDALEKVAETCKEIKPCLIPQTRTILISASPQ